MNLSADMLQRAGCHMPDLCFEAAGPGGTQVLSAEIQADRHILPPVFVPDNVRELRVLYRFRIDRPDVLFEAFGPEQSDKDVIGIGVRWSDRRSQLRGAAALDTVSRDASSVPWKVNGTVRLPVQDLGCVTRLELMVHGGNAVIADRTALTYGTRLATIATDVIELQFHTDGPAANDSQSTDHVTSPISGDSFQLREGEAGPSLAIRTVQNDVDPLWVLKHQAPNSVDIPAGSESLYLQINAGHPDYGLLAGPQLSPALIRELRASVLTTLLQTVTQQAPFASPDTPEAGLRFWIVDQYQLEHVRTPADLAAALRRPGKRRQVTWPELSEPEAAGLCGSWCGTDYPAMIRQMAAHASRNVEFAVEREELSTTADHLFRELAWDSTDSLRGAYKFDLEFGLELHRILAGLGFSARYAAKDDIWRALTVNLLPDVVATRLRRFSYKRMIGDPHRNYLRTVWWYVHLSLQPDASGNPDYAATRELLARNTTDTIQQLLDRNRDGYPLELYRELMRQLGSLTAWTDVDRATFRAVLERNVELSRTVEPPLYEGGVEGYVQDLFAGVLPNSANRV